MHKINLIITIDTLHKIKFKTTINPDDLKAKLMEKVWVPLS